MTPPTVPMPRLPRDLGDGPDTAPTPVPCPLGIVHQIDTALAAHAASMTSAAEALADLDTWLALHPAPAPAATAPDRVWVWALIVAITAGTVVGLTVWSWS